MKAMSRRALIAVALTNLFPRTTRAARHYRYRWDTSHPIIVENKLGPEWNATVKAQATLWHRAYRPLRFKVVHKPGKCRKRKGAIVICAKEMRGSHAAWARTHKIGREIEAVTIEIQPEYADPFFADTMLLCHEFGHALGLAHNDQPESSCLGSGWGTTRTTPGPYDRRSLRMLYGKKGKRWP